ncbi:hypothetical protein NDU88_003546 [Pleurodeles waltl]|uniref:Uncharacterized protein n=1 Tax=Pleurodeles waltl TaxID=8319 RepID=A0AAV7RG79_PLEWA|nr:hypothetical protein NDU88_003546 [Pleurodeles waltl]
MAAPPPSPSPREPGNHSMVGPGRCGPLWGLLIPALAPIQQAQVPTQITVNCCISPLAAPAAPLTPASSGRSSRSAVRLRRHYTTFRLDCGPKKPLDPAKTCRCLTLPVLPWCRGEAFFCPGCAGS